MVNRQPQTHVAIVVLGNQPIDGSTLTVDCVKRVHHAIELYRDRLQKNEETICVGCVLVLIRGDGTTTGRRCMTEESMMAHRPRSMRSTFPLGSDHCAYGENWYGEKKGRACARARARGAHAHWRRAFDRWPSVYESLHIG